MTVDLVGVRGILLIWCLLSEVQTGCGRILDLLDVAQLQAIYQAVSRSIHGKLGQPCLSTRHVMFVNLTFSRNVDRQLDKSDPLFGQTGQFTQIYAIFAIMFFAQISVKNS